MQWYRWTLTVLLFVTLLTELTVNDKVLSNIIEDPFGESSGIEQEVVFSHHRPVETKMTQIFDPKSPNTILFSNNLVTNPDAEINNYSGWTGNFTDIGTYDFPENKNFHGSTIARYQQMFQIINLTAKGFSPVDIDNWSFEAFVGGTKGEDPLDTSSQGQFKLYMLDENNATVGSWLGPDSRVAGWQIESGTVQVPAETRYINFTFTAHNPQGVGIGIFMDNAFVIINDPWGGITDPNFHEPIIAHSDAEFDALQANEIFPGYGNTTHPYIISGFTFNALHPEMRLIDLANLSYTITVQDCLFLGDPAEEVVVSFTNTSEISVLNSTFLEGLLAIQLANGTGVVASNNITNSGVGIELTFTTDVTILQNIVNTTDFGIFALESTGVEVQNNTIIGSDVGIGFERCITAIVSENWVFDTVSGGIVFASVLNTSHATITSNKIIGGKYGIGVVANESIIDGNIVSNNTAGIFGTRTNSFLISNNIASFCFEAAYRLTTTLKTTFTNNTSTFSTLGLELNSAHNTSAQGNNLGYLTVGIGMNENSTNNLFLNNTVHLMQPLVPAAAVVIVDSGVDGNFYNQFVLNYFFSNHTNDIVDDGANNSYERNFYSTDNSTDQNGDGYNDNPHLIEGLANSTDLHPLAGLFADSDLDNITDHIELLYGTDLTNPDTDNDLASDWEEIFVFNKTNPLWNDTDFDRLLDGEELLIYLTNATNPDTDDDSLGDWFEVTYNTDPLNPTDICNDTDADGLPMHLEHEYETNPNDPDSDNDLLSDGLEVLVYGTSPTSNDTDGDSLSDYYELFVSLTNPLSWDSDGDGLSDAEEHLTHGTDPLRADTDRDGLTDYEEVILYSTNPFQMDTDNDTLSDYEEVMRYGSSPILLDTDNDTINDTLEVLVYETDPVLPDTDFDGLSDATEIFDILTDPLVNDTDEDGLLDGFEVLTFLSDPFMIDSDLDGLEDYPEFLFGSNATNSDTDGDGMDDYYEWTYTLDPNSNDTVVDHDSDGVTTYDELVLSTDPRNPDTDGDGLTEGEELDWMTDPLNNDTDGDSLTDGDEVHVFGSQPLLVDSDLDDLTDDIELGLGSNMTNPDTDGDGLPDSVEYNERMNLFSNDTDNDLLSDEEEYYGTTDPCNNDTDGDSLMDSEELHIYSTDPTNPDSDEDGVSDGMEVAEGLDPNNPDSDSDDLSDGEESLHGSSPLLNDTDYDGVSDGDEVLIYNSNPTKKDTDGDGMHDGWEIMHVLDPTTNDGPQDLDEDGLTNLGEYYRGTNPRVADTDGDGRSDGWEVDNGYDPLVSGDTPPTEDGGDPINENKDSLGTLLGGLSFVLILAAVADFLLRRRGSS